MSSDDSLYLAVAKELTANVRDEALWTKAFALESGDEARTKAHYIRLRVEKMQRPVATDASPVKHATSADEREVQSDSVKSVVSIPNVLVLALYLAVAYGIAQKYGFSVFSLARALGVCLIPVGVCLVWNFRKGDVTWLRITSIVVTVIFGVIFVASTLQEAKETRAGAPGPLLSWSPEPVGMFDDLLPGASGSAPAKSSEGGVASEATTAQSINSRKANEREALRKAGVIGSGTVADVSVWWDRQFVANGLPLSQSEIFDKAAGEWQVQLTGKAGFSPEFALYSGYLLLLSNFKKGEGICFPDPYQGVTIQLGPNATRKIETTAICRRYD